MRKLRMCRILSRKDTGIPASGIHGFTVSRIAMPGSASPKPPVRIFRFRAHKSPKAAIRIPTKNEKSVFTANVLVPVMAEPKVCQTRSDRLFLNRTR